MVIYIFVVVWNFDHNKFFLWRKWDDWSWTSMTNKIAKKFFNQNYTSFYSHYHCLLPSTKQITIYFTSFRWIWKIKFDLQIFLSYGLELSRLALIIFHIQRKYFCNNENDVKEAWDDPGDFAYVTRLPNYLLILTTTYSEVSPLIIPFRDIYFALGWLILRNQVSWFFQHKI